MDLYLYRLSSGKHTTLSVLYKELPFNSVNLKKKEFLCFILEDEHRNEKKSGETRIPAGRYEITLRTVGGFHQRYSNRFPIMHKGMLWLRDVPNFQYVLIHIGNDEDDTGGCLLTGYQLTENNTQKGYVGDSVRAYKDIYPIISDALVNGEKVFINITDEIENE